MKAIKNIFYINILVLFIFSNIKGQNQTSQDINELYNIWDKQYSDYTNQPNRPFTNPNDLFNRITIDSIPKNNLKSEILLAESKIKEKDWGLDWKNSLLLNSAPGQEVADNIIYRSRIQSEISWNILKNGYFDNQKSSQIKKNESLIAEINNFNSSKSFEHIYKWQNIIYQFNKSKIELLNTKDQLETSQIKIVQDLHLRGKISQEEYLKNLKLIAETKSQIKIYNDYNHQLITSYENDSITYNYPLIDLNYSNLFEALKISKSDSIIFLELDNLELNKKKNNLSLRSFARYNYYDFATLNSSNKSFFTFGLGLSIPLDFNKKAKEELYQLKSEEIQTGYKDSKTTSYNPSLDYFYSFRSKLKQYYSFHYKKLIFQELLRKEQTRHEIDQLSFNPTQALNLLDDILSIEIELIDIKQQLYLLALNIYTSTPFIKIEDMVTTVQLEEVLPSTSNLPKKEQSIKGIYIWKKSIENNTVQQLDEFFKKEKMNSLIISIGKDFKQSNIDKINKLSELGYSIELMIGNNKLINSGVEAYLQNLALNINKLNITGIHLDIEPHTFDDWKSNKPTYEAKYIKMLNHFNEFCSKNNLELSVSIPLHYSIAFKTSISELVNKIYYMCYENINTSYIEKKVLKTNNTQIVIALRTEDFSSRVQLEQKAKELNTILKPTYLIVHDFERLKKLKKE